MRISNFLIGFVVIGLFVTTFGFYFSDMTTSYSTSSYYNSSEIALFDRSADIQETAESINQTLTTVENGNVVDVVGGLLTSGYTVLKTTWSSFSVYTAIVEDAGARLNAGPATSTFIVTASIVGFLALMFALIAVLTGRDKL